MANERVDTGTLAASTGLPMTESTFLDAHFETNRPEFEEIVRTIGIEAGWHVLDVGCGGGNFLPLLAEQVGPSGKLTAIDLAPENIAVVQAQTARWRLPCPVETHIGSLLALPFPDDSFDAVWCANVLMYLTDAELPRGLAELRRVVRPGGRILAKETDGALCLYYPMDPAYFAPLLIARAKTVPGAQRSRGLRTWFERAGLTVAAQRMIIVEHHAPLRPAERQYLGDGLAMEATTVAAPDLPADIQAFWRSQRNPDDPGCILDRPDFTNCEGICVFVACNG